ncbi:thymidylate synthase [Burkholderia phage vB_BglM_WTB]
MQVKLISVTPNALELLVGTKTTRMRGKSPEEMSPQELYDHFAYMLDTIRSPFEFVDYVFEISGVSKNFTHQLVRTRTGAYQQETSRALEISAFDSVCPDSFSYNESVDMLAKENRLGMLWEDAIANADASYRALIEAGAELQDARAVLPSNMPTSIKAKFNLRTLSDMSKNRLCARTQGEYQNVFRRMRALVLEQHPWADPLLQVACVATGQCAFPRWGGKRLNPNDLADRAVIDTRRSGETFYQCPHYRPWMDLTEQKNELRVSFWSREEIAQANPVARDGKSM